jgi:ubiquinol-cytochrome c reductase cytochrome b subunit
LKKDDLIIRIVNGGTNMPAFGSSLTPREMDDLVAFLQTRTANGQSAAALRRSRVFLRAPPPASPP